MTRLGFRTIAIVNVAIVGGGIWFLVAKNRLEGQIKGAQQAVNVVRAESGQAAVGSGGSSQPGVPVSAPEAASIAARSDGNPQANAPAAAPTAVTPRVRELGNLVGSGMLGQVTWRRPQKNDLFATFESVAKVLELSPAETSNLLDVVESGNQLVVQGILSTTTVTRPSPEQIVIAVRDSSDAQIAAIRMQDSIREIMGEERYRIYEDLGAKAIVDKTFSNMGLNAVTMTITKGYNERAQREMYTVSRQTPGARGGGGGSGGNRETLELNYWPLSQLVPADF